MLVGGAPVERGRSEVLGMPGERFGTLCHGTAPLVMVVVVVLAVSEQ